MNGSDDARLESLLEYLRDTRNLDLTGYKRASLSRRIHKRMEATGASGFDDYRDHLELDPDEQAKLVDTILLNVTGFFRDAPAWAYLADVVVPELVASRGSDDPIRVWSAGCASGEEAYSLAMVFADHMGLDEFRTRVKIFATDVDEAALAEARRGRYGERQLEAVSAERRDRYFETSSEGTGFRRDCRRQVIFGRNDVAVDAPISRVDLLVCRNVLMYFVSDTQRQVLNRFHYALADGGVLFLGKAETIFSHSDLFDPVSTQFRLFRRAPGAARRVDVVGHAPVSAPAALSASGALAELAAASTPVAQLVIDVDGRLVAANTKARAMFAVTVDDLHRPLADLDIAHRPVELQPHITLAYAQLRPVVVREVTRELADAQVQFLEFTVAPLCDAAGVPLGASLTFADVTELGRARADLERSARDLQHANERLRGSNEALATVNEELQSTNEELETTNEELQSSNEELETTNEELRSANEELATMNEEFLSQARQVEVSEQFLASILERIPIGLVVLDAQLDVLLWNRAIEDLFGVRSDEAIGRSFLALDIGLPVGALAPLLHAAVGEAPTDRRHLVLDAVDRRGRPVTCRAGVQRLDASRSGREVLVLVEVSSEDASEDAP